MRCRREFISMTVAWPCACLAGLVTEVRLPAPDGPQDVGAALGGGHAVRAGRHAAFLRHQHDGEGGPGHHRVSSSPALSVLVPQPDPVAPKLGGTPASTDGAAGVRSCFFPRSCL